MLIIPVAIGSSLYRNKSLAKDKVLYSLKPKLARNHMPNCRTLSFLFYKNNSVTNKLKKLVTILVSFRNRNISYTSLEL